MKVALIWKVLALGFVLLALLFALGQVSDLVHEREGRLHEAQRSVAASLADAQWLVGPVVQRHCTETWDVVTGEGNARKTSTEKRLFTLDSAPQTLSVQGHAAMDPRKRGIYTVNTYLLQSHLAARWADFEVLQPTREHTGSALQCEPVQIWLAVGDARGIRKAVVQAQGAPVEVLPGTPRAAYPQGFHVDLPVKPGANPAEPLQVDIDLELSGTEEFGLAPVGASNDVKLTSDWPHPSFSGLFLPQRPSVTGSGFEAAWQVTALASSAHREVLKGAAPCVGGATAPAHNAADTPASCIDTLGVRFIEPVNVYTLSDRATKYGLLFIVLTLVAVGLAEVMRGLRVHPIQYLLVGGALVVFFLLLVSLSEQVPFGWAYGAASAACTALLAFYGTYVLGGLRAGACFGAGIALLYGVLFMLLQLEQGALLLGSLLVFAALATVMAATRKVDWYALASQRLVRLSARPAAEAQAGASPNPTGS